MAMYMTSGFSRPRRAMKPCFVYLCFTVLYIINCEIDNAEAGTCSEAVAKATDFSFMISRFLANLAQSFGRTEEWVVLTVHHFQM